MLDGHRGDRWRGSVERAPQPERQDLLQIDGIGHGTCSHPPPEITFGHDFDLPIEQITQIHHHMVGEGGREVVFVGPFPRRPLRGEVGME